MFGREIRKIIFSYELLPEGLLFYSNLALEEKAQSTISSESIFVFLYFSFDTLTSIYKLLSVDDKI